MKAVRSIVLLLAFICLPFTLLAQEGNTTVADNAFLSEFSINKANPTVRTSKDKDRAPIKISRKLRGTRVRAVTMVKTNIAYDIWSFVNLEIEQGYRKHWSSLAELTFPWFAKSDNTWATQMLNAGFETRYWRTPRNFLNPDLRGFFIGGYVNAGLFDLERESAGTKSDFFYSGGLSFGYNHRLNKWASIEFSLAAGYFHADYQHYHLAPDGIHLVEHNQGTYEWWGPTKAKITVNWHISRFWDRNSLRRRRNRKQFTW